MKAKLKDLAETIFIGMSLSGRSPAGIGRQTVRVVNIKDLAIGRIEGENLNTVNIEALYKVDRYRIYEGDILMTARGTVFRSALVGPGFGDCIISSGVLAIRLSKKSPLVSAALYAFLESPEGIRAIQAVTRSATSQLTLTPSDIGEIIVPVPSLEVQEKIATLKDLSNRHYRASLQAAEMRRAITDEIINEMFCTPA